VHIETIAPTMATAQPVAPGSLPRVSEVMKGTSIFITGASGFLGMLKLRNIADSAVNGHPGGPKEVFVLVRPKKGCTAQERFDKEVRARPVGLCVATFSRGPSKWPAAAAFSRGPGAPRTARRLLTLALVCAAPGATLLCGPALASARPAGPPGLLRCPFPRHPALCISNISPPHTATHNQPQVLGNALFSCPSLGVTPALREWVMTHVTVLGGDITMPRLGLSDEQRAMLAERLDVTIHYAALPNFFPPVNEAVRFGTRAGHAHPARRVASSCACALAGRLPLLGSRAGPVFCT
jgi:hypothetical protein